MRKTFYIIIAAVCAAGCDSGAPAEPESYRAVQDLFARTCAGSACHVGALIEPAGQLDLSPGTECAQLVGVPASEAPDQTRLVPGDPAASYLHCKLVPDCERRLPGSTVMPLGSPSGLPADDLAIVTRWIEEGAPGCAGPDDVPPAFDGAASAMPLPSAIQLSWSPARDDTTPAAEIVYLVYEAGRSGEQDFGAPTAVTEPGAASVTIGGLPVSATRFYVVRARDAAGNIDGNSAEVSATTPAVGDETAPEFGGVASASAVGSTSVNLAWQPASDDVVQASAIRYRVYVATSSGGQEFATPDVETAAGATDALVTDLTANTTYFFVVRAVDPSGNEDQNTAERSATTGEATSFSAQIEPLLAASCGAMGCHGGVFPAQDLDLRAGASYGDLVGAASTQCNGRVRVTPSDPDASYLVNKLTGVDMCFGTVMPKIGMLPAADRQLITDWIREGALDN